MGVFSCQSQVMPTVGFHHTPGGLGMGGRLGCASIGIRSTGGFGSAMVIVSTAASGGAAASTGGFGSGFAAGIMVGGRASSFGPVAGLIGIIGRTGSRFWQAPATNKKLVAITQRKAMVGTISDQVSC